MRRQPRGAGRATIAAYRWPSRVMPSQLGQPFLQLVGVRLGVDALLRQMLEDHLVCPGMPGLLLDKGLDSRFHLRVADQRFRLGHGPNEPTLAFWQQQMHHI